MSFRITNGMMTSNYLRNLNGNMQRMNTLQNQLSTGRRIVRLSDDPVGVIKSLNARSKLSDIDQYQRNIDDARTWLNESETAVAEINEVIKRAKELAVSMANGTNTDESRAAMSNEILQLRDQVLSACNVKLGDNFLFGGYNINKQPFTIDGNGNVLFNGVDLISSSLESIEAARAQEIEFDIGYSQRIQASISGIEVMGTGDKNIYKMLQDFYNVLNDPDSADTEIAAFIDMFGERQSEVLAIQAEIGGRQNRLDMMTDRYSQDYISYTELKSMVEDIDQAEGYMWFAMAQAVYHASMAIGGKVIQPSLMDFIR